MYRFNRRAHVSKGDMGSFFAQLRLVMVLPHLGHRVLPPAQVVPQLEHWDIREGRTGFTGPQA